MSQGEWAARKWVGHCVSTRLTLWILFFSFFSLSSMTAQFEHTIYLGPMKKEVVSRGEDY
jgi:hypothetical protein